MTDDPCVECVHSLVPQTSTHTHTLQTLNTMMKAAAVMLLAVSVAAQEKAKIRFYGESM